jgi:hypothetical protein
LVASRIALRLYLFWQGRPGGFWVQMLLMQAGFCKPLRIFCEIAAISQF